MVSEVVEKARVRITLPKELHEEAAAFAADQDRTLNNLIVHTLNTYLKRYRKN